MAETYPKKARVTAWWYSEWLDAEVFEIVLEQGSLKIHVQWADGSGSVVDEEHVSLPPAAARPAVREPPAPAAQMRPRDWLDSEHPAVTVVSREQQWADVEMITPAHNFMSPASAMDYPWICHKCRKRFPAEDTVIQHIGSANHQKKAYNSYSLNDWVTYNRGYSFYDLPQVPAPPTTPPPPSGHVYAGPMQ